MSLGFEATEDDVMNVLNQAKKAGRFPFDIEISYNYVQSLIKNDKIDLIDAADSAISSPGDLDEQTQACMDAIDTQLVETGILQPRFTSFHP